MNLNFRARLYVAVTAAAAAALFAHWAWAAGRPAPAGSALLLMAILAVQAAVLVHFPVLVAPRFKVDATPAIYFAGLLLLGPGPGMVVTGASRLVAELVMVARVDPSRGRRMATPVSAVFNAAQLTLATGAAGLVEEALRPGWILSPSWAGLAVALASAAAFYAVSEVAVAGMVWLLTGRRPDVVLAAAVRRDVLENAALLVAGLLVALACDGRPWLALLLSPPAALALVSVTKTMQLLEQTVAAVEAMADVVDRRDPYTFEHSQRVAANAVRVARRMGLAASEVETIRLAARVHDLGKVGLPDSILHKEGRLTEEEFALMRRHPEIGAELLSRFPRFSRGRDLVLGHHERPDGRGYPAGLSGAEIPLGARIIAAADAYDAMTSARPYRPAMPVEKARAELLRGRGTQWDAAVVDAMLAVAGDAAGEAEPHEVGDGLAGRGRQPVPVAHAAG